MKVGTYSIGRTTKIRKAAKKREKRIDLHLLRRRDVKPRRRSCSRYAASLNPRAFYSEYRFGPSCRTAAAPLRCSHALH